MKASTFWICAAACSGASASANALQNGAVVEERRRDREDALRRVEFDVSLGMNLEATGAALSPARRRLKDELMDATSNVRKSTESSFDHMLHLADDDDLTFHWNDPVGNTVECRLIHKTADKSRAPGWLGVGFYDTNVRPVPTSSEGPAMIGSDAVIGRVADKTVAKYHLEAKTEGPGGVAPMDAVRQTLVPSGTKITQHDGDDESVTTILTLEKLLEEADAGEVRLKRVDKNVLLYAVGAPGAASEPSDALGKHDNAGMFSVDFDEVSRLAHSGGERDDRRGDDGGQHDADAPVAENGADDDELNACASDDADFLHMIRISDTLTFHWNLDVWNDRLPPSLTAKLHYTGEAWLGFGVSPDGRMIGGEAIIGRPDLALADEEKPLKYHLAAKDVTGIQAMEEAKQTLVDASIVQDDTGTTMRFTKLLEEDDEHPIYPGGANTFLYAVGSSNVLSKHKYSGSFDLDLSHCQSPQQVTHHNQMQAAWAFHGTVGCLAMGIATPIAVATAWFRTLVPSSWIYMHVFSNVASFFLIGIAFFTAITAMSFMDHPRHFSIFHHMAGLAIVILVTFQVINGFLRPPVERKDPYAMEPQPTGLLQCPTSPREIWHLLHRTLGVTILGLGIFQVQSGLNMFADKFNVSNAAPLFWGYLCIFVASLIGLKVWMICEEMKVRRGLEAVTPEQRKMGSIAVSNGIDPDSELVPVHFEMQ